MFAHLKSVSDAEELYFLCLCATCLEYQQTQAHKKRILYDLPLKPLEVVGSDIFL